MTPNEQKIPAAVRNEFFYLFARLCMVFATVVGLPVATWMLNRVIATGDDIRVQLQAQNVSLQLLTSEVKYRSATTEDHERRLRRLEFGSR